MPPKKKPRLILAANRSDQLKYRLGEVQALFHFLDKIRPEAIPKGELSVVFMDEAEHSSLHYNFMEDKTPTDVITFPGDPAMNFAGEICVSVDYAHNSAQERDLSLARELTLYLVHGWLHLAGFDDKGEIERKKIREEETRLLTAIEKAERQPHFSVA